MISTSIVLGALAVTVSALPHVAQDADASCSPLELVIARGTTEPLAPSFGVIVGDPLFSAVSALIPGITGYSVNYPASFEAGSRNLGRDDVVQHVQSQAAKCPQQKFVLVGYSQGGDVMHSAAAKLDPSIFPRIVAVTLFGDPGNKGPTARSPLECDPIPPIPLGLANKLKQNCNKGDPVCTNDGTDIEAHLTYLNADVGAISSTANYILKQYQTDGKAGPSPSPNVGTGDNSKALADLGVVLGASVDTLKAKCVIPTRL